jgi:hypothetical protein
VNTESRLELAKAALTSIGKMIAEYPANENVVVEADVITALRRIVNDCLSDIGADSALARQQ